MTKHALLQALRRQAIDDEIGVVCARPTARAAEYFRMSLDLLAPPAPLRAQIESLAALPRGSGDERSYAAWRNLFDLVTHCAATGACAPHTERILAGLATHALHNGDAAELEAVLGAYHSSTDVAGPDFLPALCREAAAAPEPGRNACRAALLAAWRREDLPVAWGEPALAAAASVPALLEHLRDPAALAQQWTAHARRATSESGGRLDHLAALLETSRPLLHALGAGAGYASIYREAVRAVASSDAPCDERSGRLLAEAHPSPDGLAELLALRAVWRDAEHWKSFLCQLCRLDDPAARRAFAQEHATAQLSALLQNEPAAWPAALQQAAAVLGAEYPDAALRARWLDQVNHYAVLSHAHVEAVSRLAAPAARAAAEPWTRLAAGLGAALTPVDRTAWHRIALDILGAASRWDPAHLAAAMGRWRTFTHVLLLANPGLGEAAGRIMACQRETLDGPLYEACRSLRPGKSATELDQLKACGVGVGA